MKKIMKINTIALMGLLSVGAMSVTDCHADPATEQTLSNVLNQLKSSDNLTREEMTNALINYDAAARMNEYNDNQQLLFMSAPGSSWALSAGQSVGGSGGAAASAATLALKQSNRGFLNAMSPFTGKPTQVSGVPGLPSSESNIQAEQQRSRSPRASLWNSFTDFFYGGDARGLVPFNPGLFILSDNLKTGPVGNISGRSQEMINNLTNPYPLFAVEAATADNLKKGNPLYFSNNVVGGGAGGEDQENIMGGVLSSMPFSLSASVLADLVARRTPSGTEPRSMIDIMSGYSQQRFSQPDWYQKMGRASDAALLRELAHMQAYTMWLQFQQYKIQEQQTALLASINAMMATMNGSMQQLTVQMQASTAQVSGAMSNNPAMTGVTAPTCGSDQIVDPATNMCKCADTTQVVNNATGKCETAGR